MVATYPIQVHRHRTREEMGAAAGRHAADLLRGTLATRGRARLMLAAAPSQEATLSALADQDVEFSRVECFHMDDYLGLDPSAPQGFGNWLEGRFVARVHPAVFHRIDPTLPPERAAADYAERMGIEPFDLVLCGLGVNAHLAFNDPPAALADPLAARVVALDEVSRRQQVDEGHFAAVEDVPTHAVTVTIPRLLDAHHVIASVPGAAKRTAVARTLAEDITPDVPGTALRTHPDAHLYVDAEAHPGVTGPTPGRSRREARR